MAQIKFYRGLHDSYDSDGVHVDCIYFSTDTHEILMNGTSYGFDKTGNKLVEDVTYENNIFKIKYTDGSEDKTIDITTALSENVKYDSAMDDGLATVNDLGGIKKGTTAGDLKKKTLSQVFDDLLFPTVNPTFEAPTATLSLKSTSTTPTVQEVGSTGGSVPTQESFNTGFNKGAIKIAGTKKQDRSGELIAEESFIYIGSPSVKEFPTEIVEGATTYRYRAAYSEGPQPLNSKGESYGSPLPKGTVDSSAVTINGVYPYYTNSASNSVFAKLTLTTNTTLSAVKFVAEGPSKHAFKLPAKYTLTKVELLNTLSGKYENYGTDKFTVTEENINVQGKQVNYKVYTRNDTGFNGESTFNITFSK